MRFGWTGIAALIFLSSVCPGQNQCRSCHPREVAAFEASPMGRSIGEPAIITTARLRHKASGSTIVVERHGREMLHRVERRGAFASYPVAYSVGAGLVGYSYIVRLGEYLFQSPVSFYTQNNTWDVTPGYEREQHLDFTHPITSGCLFCHTGSLHLVTGSANRFQDPAFTAISCERCHGPARQHLNQPVSGSILNPAKLPASARDSVCEQCHLEGVVRILNPGRDWWDYTPGTALEVVFATYVEEAPVEAVRAVSHSEQLAQSRCARESGGRLWCGSCHSPHSPPTDRAAQVRQTCLSCHESLFASEKHAPARECVSCHMPRLQPVNVAHSAVTDHRIVRKPGTRSVDAPAATKLRPWREPDARIAVRDLGLAYFDWAENDHDNNKLKRSYQLLSQAPPEARDAPVLADLASLLLAQGQRKLPVRLFAQAVNADYTNARYAYCLGVARERAGEHAEAIQELRRSIQLDPSQPDPYLALAGIYDALGQSASKRETINEYLKFMPQNLAFRSGN